MIYSYEAKDAAGHKVTGSLDARDERSAAMLVREQGYFPMRLMPAFPGRSERSQDETCGAASNITPGRWLMVHLVYPIWSGVSLNELALNYRQFAAMLHAGVPVYQCLTTLAVQTHNRTFRRILENVSQRLQKGQSLSSALGEYPWVFTDFHRAMIAAGETSGRLDLMFARLADALEQEQSLRRSIRRETFYPKAVLVSSFLLPPLFYLITGGVMAYLQHSVVPLLWLLAAAGGVFMLNRLGAQATRAYHTLLAVLPGLGGTVRMIALARFSRTLASLYAAGIALPQALRSAADTCGNAYLGGRIVQAIPRVQAGHGIVESLRDTNVFPPMVISMLGTGEQTGSLDQTMDKVAEFYEQESVLRLHQASVMLGVLAFLVAAIVTAVDVFSFYTGHMSQYNDLLKPDAD